MQLKIFFRDSDGINKHQEFPEDEIDQSGDDCIKNPIKVIIQNNQPPEKKAIKSSDHICGRYSNIMNSFPDSNLSEKRENILLPCIYIKPDDDMKKSFNEKIKVIVRKLLKSFDSRSGLIMCVAELIDSKNCKSA